MNYGKVLAFVKHLNRTMAKPFKRTYEGKVLTASHLAHIST